MESTPLRNSVSKVARLELGRSKKPVLFFNALTDLIVSTPSLLITLDGSLNTSDFSDYQQPRLIISSRFIHLFFIYLLT